MKRILIIFWFAVIASFTFSWPSAIFAQSEASGSRGERKGSSQSGLTGAGTGASIALAAKPGEADSAGNPQLGGLRHPLYRLHPTDVVEISFTVAPEFNQTLTVQPDGYVMLKDAGMVRAEGLDLCEFTDAIEKAYRGYLHDPQVAVSLKDFAHPYFIVGGQVEHPGKFELRSDTTVAEAVEIAGGLTPRSKSSQVILFRRVNDELVQTRLLDMKKMLKGKGLREDAHLESGDLVFVPQNTISKIAPFITRPSMGMYVGPNQF